MLLVVALGLQISGCKASDLATPSVCTSDCAPTPIGPPTASGRWVNGYYVGYQRALYPEQTIDFATLTHITVARVRPLPNGSITTDFDIDDVNGPVMARNVSSQAHQAGRKAILMLGGAGEHLGFVGAASPANRPTFVRNLLAAMTAFGYDGIDVDWEPMDAADQAPLLALLRELRAARPGMILTLPVGFVNSNSPAVGPWYSEAAPLVDQMNLMTYEMAGAWGGWQSWHSSALDDAQPDHPTSIASSVAAYTAAGVPAGKLGIGIPFFGVCWRGVTAARQVLPAGAGIYAGDNTMTYANILSQYYDAAARGWDAAASVPYLSFSTAKGLEGCNFVSYEDEQSVAAKGAFVKSRGLGGAIIWTINQGHLLTAPTGRRDPLLQATYAAIVP
jgi:chitinase